MPHPPLPEVYYAPQQQQQQGQQQPQYYQSVTPKPDDQSTVHYTAYTPTSQAASVYGGGSSTLAYDHSHALPPIPSEYGGRMGQSDEKSRRGTICGCSFIVFILSVVIAALAAAVIGLAAGTGLEASRANTAEAKLASFGGAAATVTVTAPVPTSTGVDFNLVDNNCSLPNSPTNGQTYTTQCESTPIWVKLLGNRHLFRGC